MISSKGVYGLSAMFELYGLNSDKPVQIKEIARLTNIPQNYLEQLLNTLKKADFLKSVRGAYGGYMLNKDASNFKVIDILKALEGDIVVCNVEVDNPVLELFWSDSSDRLRAIFDLTLSDLDSYRDKINSNISFII